jgi:integrase
MITFRLAKPFVRKDGKSYTSKDLNRIWRAACKQAGVPHLKLYNAIRHSLARNLQENDYGFDMVAEVLGHASVEMSRNIYADMPMNKVRDALSDLSESQNWVDR